MEQPERTIRGRLSDQGRGADHERDLFSVYGVHVVCLRITYPRFEVYGTGHIIDGSGARTAKGLVWLAWAFLI